MSDLNSFRDHCREMSKARHKPECMVRVRPWLKAEPTCGAATCISPGDRALWTRLADEVDAYLSHDEEGLFA